MLRGMLSPEPSLVLRSGAQAFSPAEGDPRVSRSTPDAPSSRPNREGEAGRSGFVVGDSSLWAGGTARRHTSGP